MTFEEKQELEVLSKLKELKNHNIADRIHAMEVIYGNSILALQEMAKRGLVDNTFYAITKPGLDRVDYLNKKKKKDRFGETPKVKVIVYDILKILLGVAIGYIIRLESNPKDNPKQSQKQPSQQLPKNSDTARKT